MRAAGRRGFTLVEMIMVTALAAMFLITLFSLSLQMSRAGLYAQRSQRSQIGLADALSLVTRELRQATYVSQPAAGGPSSTLEGCSNAALFPGSGDFAPLDPDQPMRWFAFCGYDGRVFYHAGEGCPPSYGCGNSPAMSFGDGPDSPASASFVRPAPSVAEIDVSLALRSKDQASSVRSAVVFAAAAGRNQ